MNPIKFKIGNYYQHAGGKVMHIIGEANTFFHGATLLGEDAYGRLSPIGKDKDAAMGWHLVSGWPRSTYEGNSIPEATESSCHPSCDNSEEPVSAPS